MIYVWKCNGCDEAVEVSRPVADMERPPEGEEVQHAGCDGADFRRVLSPAKSIRILENEDRYW